MKNSFRHLLIFSGFLLLILFSSCQFQKRQYSLQSVLWQQQAAEYKALSFQAYNVARLQLDNYLSRKKEDSLPPAIVTDIDETVLDNSPFQARLIRDDLEYSDSLWMEWGKLKKAAAIPGALEFFLYAAEQGVEIFYVTNRLTGQTEETLCNLDSLGFPFADRNHFLAKEESSGKETRRAGIRARYEIVLLIGDNLSDFSAVFDRKHTEERNRLADSLRMEFGTRFIVLPNPMYGDWESKGILEGRYDWTPWQKDSLMHKKLQSY